MFQGWSRRNNPQAKVLTTVPRAALHQEVVREPTVRLEESAVKKSVEKRPKASKKEEEWVQVPIKKDLWKNKRKAEGDWTLPLKRQLEPGGRSVISSPGSRSRSQTWIQLPKRKTSRMQSEAFSTKNRSWS